MTESIGEASESEPPRFEAFVDGRVDEEKLAELLSFPGGSHLEFKAEKRTVNSQTRCPLAVR